MILDDIKASTVARVAEAEKMHPIEELRSLLPDTGPESRFAFKHALCGDGMHFICEIKKASPSKGVMAEDFPYKDIAAEYEKAGADCISCLTEPEYFKGDIRYLSEIRKTVSIPILRKDFTCDEYMIYEAALNGADAVLLIAAILSDEELAGFGECAESLGLSCVFEAHDADEVSRCLNAGAGILGVNNRNLKDFSVDINNSLRLREMVPPEVIFVAESGIKTCQDVRALKAAGVNACLIGETLMRADDKATMIRSLRG